ncbi:MAG: phosphopyruvate hydratase, partial [Bacteriovorax sp.]
LCMPKGLESAKAAIERNQEIYSQLGEVLKKNGLSTNVGNEGAYAPDGIESNEKPLKYLVEAIESLGLRPGEDAVLGIDAAASEFYQNGKYNLDRDGVSMDGENLIEYWLKWIEKYPIATVEDMLFEDDWENWTKLTAKLPSGVLNIGDDLTATNSKRWQRAIDTKAANSILIKLNQAGTVSETIDCCILAKVHGLPTIPSHRGGGETDDTFLVDLAVAVGSKYIKVGPTRGERVVKYNRLMEIEEELKMT